MDEDKVEAAFQTLTDIMIDHDCRRWAISNYDCDGCKEENQKDSAISYLREVLKELSDAD